MNRYVTLFDSGYAAKGDAMLRSLARTSRDPYEVTVIALDDAVAARSFANAVVVPVAVLEAAVPGLDTLRRLRKHNEWCWTLASVALRWKLGQVEPGEVVTYLDADLWFYSDPAALLRELGDGSIAVVPHRFPPEYAHYAASSGTFNVSWVSLRRDWVGRACAEAWAGEVLADCSELRGGDQRCLDAWPARYGAALCTLRPGAGVAPWNVWGYEVAPGDPPTVNGSPVVFYHYHELALPPCGAPTGVGIESAGRTQYLDGYRLTLGYPLRRGDIETFYRGYLKELGAC